jgi:hypothetical protein
MTPLEKTTIWIVAALSLFTVLMALAVSAEAQNRTQEMTLTWSDNSDSLGGKGADEDGFNIYRRIDSSPQTKVASTARNVATFTDVVTAPQAAKVCYAVSAFNAGGESAKTAETCAVMQGPPPVPVPNIPGAVTITITVVAPH